jgi:predicted  nucleic acid-binding Zn-ribbon protein
MRESPKTTKELRKDTSKQLKKAKQENFLEDLIKRFGKKQSKAAKTKNSLRREEHKQTKTKKSGESFKSYFQNQSKFFEKSQFSFLYFLVSILSLFYIV